MQNGCESLRAPTVHGYFLFGMPREGYHPLFPLDGISHFSPVILSVVLCLTVLLPADLEMLALPLLSCGRVASPTPSPAGLVIDGLLFQLWIFVSSDTRDLFHLGFPPRI